MGVDLGAILERKQVTLDAFKGKRIAIDAFNTIYQFITIIRQPDGTPLQDSRGRITSHMSGVFYRTCNMLERGIRPTYVFDGAPSEMKKETLEARALAKKQAMELMVKAQEEGRTQEAAMLAQRTAKLTPDMVGECKKLLDFMGVPWIQAPSEGEAQCAKMCQDGLVHATGSQDYDSLLFGTPVLARNLTVSGKRKIASRNMYVEVFPEEIDLSHNLQVLGITREQLVWIGLLSGTDFNKGVHGIGPKKGLKLAKECKTLQELTLKLSEKAQGMDLAKVEELFLTPPAKKVSPQELEFKPFDREKIIGLMCTEHEFSEERVNTAIAKAYSQPLDSAQSSLEKWF